MKPYLFTFFGLILAGCGGGNGNSAPQPGPPPSSSVVSLSMDAAAWQFQYSPGMPTSPSAYGNGWSFDFPAENGVHYLTQGSNGKLGSAIAASVAVQRADGAALYEVQPCGDSNAPRARLYFQRRGDNLGGQGPYEFYRWWSVATIDLNTDGPVTLTVSTTSPDQWSSVYGKGGSQAPDAFTAAANDLQAVGLTYGGCFAGHGVYAIGAVKFIADRVAVEP